MGFFPCKVEPDIWLQECNGLYKYIAVYINDLAIVSQNPQEICNILHDEYYFKLKGTGPIKFHLGCDFFCDETGVLYMASKKYIEKIEAKYERMFGEKLKEGYKSPLEKGDYPEIDTTEFLETDGIKKYQSLIGALQWAISIGRLDITMAVVTMSGFQVAPRIGHLERLKRICGYLKWFKGAHIYFATMEPDYSSLPDLNYDWTHLVYGKVDELIPMDIPTPLGNYVTMTTYVDANLYHDMLMGDH